MGDEYQLTVPEPSPELVNDLIRLDPVAHSGDDKRRNELEAWVAARQLVIASAESDIVGYAAIIPGHLFGRDFVAMLLVAPGHRRRGIGSALLEAITKRATSDRVFTSTNNSNAPMRALLQSCWWKYSGTLDGLDPGDPEEFFYLDR